MSEDIYCLVGIEQDHLVELVQIFLGVFCTLLLMQVGNGAHSFSSN